VIGNTALVPRPRLHLIRFHGVLAPHAGLRIGASALSPIGSTRRGCPGAGRSTPSPSYSPDSKKETGRAASRRFDSNTGWLLAG
jgi:hypothetical protein